MLFSELNFGNMQGPDGTLWDVAEHVFSNGYGVSIIRGGTSIGGEDGLWEVNIIHGGRLMDDPTTVLEDWKVGRYTEEEVETLMGQVESL